MFPKKELLEIVIRQALKSGKARSKEELASRVSSILKRIDADYRAGGRRVKKLALEMHDVNVRIITKKGKKRSDCPACGEKLKEVRSRNLRGEFVLTGMKCEGCGFSANGGRWSPARYEFSLK